MNISLKIMNNLLAAGLLMNSLHFVQNNDLTLIQTGYYAFVYRVMLALILLKHTGTVLLQRNSGYRSGRQAIHDAKKEPGDKD